MGEGTSTSYRMLEKRFGFSNEKIHNTSLLPVATVLSRGLLLRNNTSNYSLVVE